MTSTGVSVRRRNLVHMRDVLIELVARDIKLRYKRSLLGIAWSLLVPLSQLAVMYVVFHQILPLNIPHYTSFLFTGILPWTWFQSSLMNAAVTIVDNRDMVKQVGFPVALLPTITVISQLIHFLLALPILAVFLWFDGYRPSMVLLALPAVILLQFIFVVGMAYVVATFQVTFRDTQYLLGLALFLLFYLTPVFYDGSGLTPEFRTVYNLNPMVHLLEAYRSILIQGQLPSAWPLLILSVVSITVFSVGYIIFMRARDMFVEEL